ncbi:MAG: 1-(5-phosphoribosyl)-5-[(5-phosphoribosylamino)methylideneamino]imidazole-4-carboxamide isomerase [Clostridiales bacterium]|jgi:phosphoribosylformimino-5-aminoimidazole carboxamide ribotide isomerase|nr:1-(5-phosphoribosyl)-5-[(5-phosphoribosylamino)methylideneamino]imidazole-4-carboxamide isomerase [Clostridiales bacterium]
MILFPAIDILDGKAVRLRLGLRCTATVYGEPAEFAKKWVKLGAEYLHIVDLNAAFDGTSVNDEIIRDIRSAVGVSLQLGGGFRSIERVKFCLGGMGIDRAVIGSAAVTNPGLFLRAAELFGDRIVCGVDERDGRVSIKGWTEDAKISPLELCQKIKTAGITSVVYTDITRDGALTGVNVGKTAELQRLSGLNVIASGGVAGDSDIEALKARGVYGAILGKALYTGALELDKALTLASE